MPTVPWLGFSTDEIARPNRLDAWRTAMAPLFEVAAPDDDGHAFEGAAFTAFLGPLAVGGTRMGALAYERTKALVRRDQTDHFLLRLDYTPSSPGGILRLIDLGQPIRLPPEPMVCLCAFIPRDALLGVLPQAESLHGREIGGARGRLLADHLRGVVRAAGEADIADAPALAEATLLTIAACLSPSPVRDEPAMSMVEAALLRQARGMIERELCDPGLTPARLAAGLSISRATLYRLFQADGGVARYVQKRRLRCIHRLLGDPRERRTIGELSFDFCFGDEASFARAFRREFGCTASEVRARKAARTWDPAVPEAAPDDLSADGRIALWGQWMRGLGI
ncbi:helix-turn-helix domain-containing protein [Caulobacter flavus]|nr:helix-turn-helix domain-containing protein [Caulobacter flavus]